MGCGVWGVGCGVWGVECGTWSVETWEGGVVGMLSWAGVQVAVVVERRGETNPRSAIRTYMTQIRPTAKGNASCSQNPDDHDLYVGVEW